MQWWLDDVDLISQTVQDIEPTEEITDGPDGIGGIRMMGFIITPPAHLKRVEEANKEKRCGRRLLGR